MSDVVDLIMKDYREFERMLAQMESDPTSRATVLPVFATLLTAHRRAEEDEVYPAASAADGADDVAHSQEEHVDADRLTVLGQAFLASREDHLGAGPGDITRDEVQQQARNMELEGTSGMSKAELQRTLLAEAESED